MTTTTDNIGSLGSSAKRFNNLFIGGTIQTTSTTMGITQKLGSAAGNYTTTSTSFVAVDSSNLSITVTVPTGWKEYCVVVATVWSNTAGASISFGFQEGASTRNQQFVEQQVATRAQVVTDQWTITGDGASHTLDTVWATSAGTATMNNSTTAVPNLTCTLMPSS